MHPLALTGASPLITTEGQVKRIPILAPGLPAIGSRAVGLLAARGTFAVPADARELSLSCFMGSKHPMNRTVFMPYA